MLCLCSKIIYKVFYYLLYILYIISLAPLHLWPLAPLELCTHPTPPVGILHPPPPRQGVAQHTQGGGAVSRLLGHFRN